MVVKIIDVKTVRESYMDGYRIRPCFDECSSEDQNLAKKGYGVLPVAGLEAKGLTRVVIGDKFSEWNEIYMTLYEKYLANLKTEVKKSKVK